MSPSRYEVWMRRALAAADVDGDPDVPVGAVVLGPDGAELAVARNARERSGDPTAHAEILALRAAAGVTGQWRLEGCTLVVTLEPCTMCAGAIVLSRIATLVFGAWEPKTGAVGSLWDVVRDRRLNHRPEVIPGVLEAECSALLVDFFTRQRDALRPGVLGPGVLGPGVLGPGVLGPGVLGPGVLGPGVLGSSALGSSALAEFGDDPVDGLGR